LITGTLAKLLEFFNEIDKSEEGLLMKAGIRYRLIQIIGTHEDECEIEESSYLRHTAGETVYRWKDDKVD
jgi:hypothetical protein